MRYSSKPGKSEARAYAVSAPLSLKQSVEVCNFIRGRDVSRAIAMLESVSAFKSAVPYTRFNSGGTGHRKGIGPGRYPVTVCRSIISLLSSAIANAKQKGLPEGLVISSIIPKQGPNVPRYGRQRGRSARRVHIEVVLSPSENKGTVNTDVKKQAKHDVQENQKQAKQVKKQAAHVVNKK